MSVTLPVTLLFRLKVSRKTHVSSHPRRSVARQKKLDQAIRQTGLTKTPLPIDESGKAVLHLIEGATPDLQSMLREHGKEIFDTSRSDVVYRRETP